jgi:hypothetical protein
MLYYSTKWIAAILACAGLISPAPAAALVPSGFYALSGGQPPQPPSAAVLQKPFVDGFSLRIRWNLIEPSSGKYDFSVIDASLAALAPYGKKLTVAVIPLTIPDYLVAAPGVETYSVTTSRATTKVPVPWDNTQLTRWEALMKALASHKVPSGSTQVAFRDHPLVANIAATIPGMNGIRDTRRTLVNLPGYNRARLTAVILRAVDATVTQFPKQVRFVPFFGMKDKTPTPPLDEALLAALKEKFFNGSTPPQIALFQENLACATPVPQFAWALYQEQKNVAIMFQMLQGWLMPFESAPKTDVCLVTATPGDRSTATSGPETGIRYAYQTYGARYFEIYVPDLTHAAFANALQTWHDVVTGATGSALPASLPRSPQPSQR